MEHSASPRSGTPEAGQETEAAVSLDSPSKEVSKVDSPSKDSKADPAFSVVEDVEEQPAKEKKRKLVGFAPEPEEDLEQHHKYLEERRKDKLKSNPFWKVPPELAYLEQRSDKDGPKPLPGPAAPRRQRKAKKLEDMHDLPVRAVKEISTVNKSTALNFNYHEVQLPIGDDRILVEVKYASLASFDMTKLLKYALNISYERVGLGYDFVGVIASVGRNYINSDEFRVGMHVFGVTNPADRKGSLQTCVIVNPSDILLPIADAELQRVGELDLKLSFDSGTPFRVGDQHPSSSDSLSDEVDEAAHPPDVPPKVPPKDELARRNSKLTKDPFLISGELEPLAKFCIFASQYCRAKQSLALMDKVFDAQKSANILINGADTCLGYTLIQTLASSVYKDVLPRFNVTLIVQEKNEKAMRALVAKIGSGGMRKFHVITFDLVNTDIVLPGEKVPVNYKKVPYFASEIIESLFGAIPESEPILKANVAQAKLDLLIDIVGSKKMLQKATDLARLDEVEFPLKKRLAPGVSVASLFGRTKEPLFLKLMKAKARGASFVSYCRFTLLEPSYSVETLVNSKARGYLNPWASSWTLGLANQIGKYNYYEKFDLECKERWVREGLQLLEGGELAMKIDEVVDWRNNFRKYIADLKEQDGQVVFKVETF